MKKQLYLVLAVIILVAACKDNDPSADKNQPISKEILDGFVQKGPFINGTEISLFELDADLNQSGTSYTSQVLDNTGAFRFVNVNLDNPVAEFKADGFYYNEITGEISESRLVLYGLSDLTNRESLNINVLSHLERARVLYLVEQGSTFEQAKDQAESDILALFEMEVNENPEFESLSIDAEGGENGMLLAASVILQGYRSTAELSELLANISTDFRSDGTLDSESLGSGLRTYASILDLEDIRTKLESRYEDMGQVAVIPDFETHVAHFIENSGFEYLPLVSFPETGKHGKNILFADTTTVFRDQMMSFAANLSPGSNIKIEMNGGIWFMQVMPDGPVNWDWTIYDYISESQTFYNTEAGKNCDVKMGFGIDFEKGSPDTVSIKIYENNSTEVTREKIVIVK